MLLYAVKSNKEKAVAQLLAITGINPFVQNSDNEDAIALAKNNSGMIEALCTHQELLSNLIERTYKQADKKELLQQLASKHKEAFIEIISKAIRSKTNGAKERFMIEDLGIRDEKILSACLAADTIEFVDQLSNTDYHALLKEAIATGSIQWVKYLHQKGASVDSWNTPSTEIDSFLQEQRAQRKEKQTKKEKEATYNRLNNQYHGNKYLIAAHQNDSTFLETHEDEHVYKRELTPTIVAIQKKALRALEILIKKYPTQVNEADATGKTPLLHALLEKNVDAANSLIHNEALLHVLDDSGISILQLLHQEKQSLLKSFDELIICYINEILALPCNEAVENVKKQNGLFNKLSKSIRSKVLQLLINQKDLSNTIFTKEALEDLLKELIIDGFSLNETIPYYQSLGGDINRVTDH